MACRIFIRHQSGRKILLANQEHLDNVWIPVRDIEKKLRSWLQDIHLMGEMNDSNAYELESDRQTIPTFSKENI